MPRFLYRVLTLLFLTLAFSGPAPGKTLQPKEAAPTPWLAAEESGDIVYFVFTAPSRIRRYDLEAAAWLSDIPLAEAPTAFTVDAEHLYVSFGRRTSRFALNGAGELHLKNTPHDASILFVFGNYLYIGSGAEFVSIDKQSGTQIDTLDTFYYFSGAEVAPSLGKVFGHSYQISSLTLNPDGTFGGEQGPPFSSDYPNGDRTFVFPGEARVADDSGIVYNTSDLSFSNSLGGSFEDLAFFGDLPIVLRGGEVISYSNAFLETGRYKPARKPLKINVRNDQVFSFFGVPGGIDAEHFSIALLTPEEPGQPVDPNGLAYDPDNVIVGKDEVVYLLSRSNLSIFRWSIPLRRYLPTIPLVKAPSYMAYSAKTHRLYLSYPEGDIRQIRLGVSLHETPFVNSPQTPCGLATAGEYVFVCDPTGAWVSHFTYTPEGALLSQVEWNYYSAEYVWSEANRRMYHFRDDTSPNDIHWEEVKLDGHLGEMGESPYHGEIRTLHPIRVAPDGSIVVLGSGEIFEAHTLERTDALSNDISDAAWLRGTLFTLRAIANGSELQKWGTNYSVVAHSELAGVPLALFGRANQLLAVTRVNGIPQFSLRDSALNESVNPTPLSLAESRFSIFTTWRTREGLTGEGHPIQLTRDTGYFWFFSPENVEMVLKILDACSYNGRLWVFAGGLTDVEVSITIVDNQTGEVRIYGNLMGQAFQPIQDTDAFTGCSAGLEFGSEILEAPLPAGAELALNENRFDVSASWQTPDGQSGTGQPLQLTPDTGYFWFFDASNVEVVVKVLNGCAVNGRFWVFAGGLTSVATEIRVTDTTTGETRTYVNPQGRPFLPIQDTSAFRCP